MLQKKNSFRSINSTSERNFTNKKKSKKSRTSSLKTNKIQSLKSKNSIVKSKYDENEDLDSRIKLATENNMLFIPVFSEETKALLLGEDKYKNKDSLLDFQSEINEGLFMKIIKERISRNLINKSNYNEDIIYDESNLNSHNIASNLDLELKENSYSNSIQEDNNINPKFDNKKSSKLSKLSKNNSILDDEDNIYENKYKDIILDEFLENADSIIEEYRQLSKSNINTDNNTNDYLMPYFNKSKDFPKPMHTSEYNKSETSEKTYKTNESRFTISLIKKTLNKFSLEYYQPDNYSHIFILYNILTNIPYNKKELYKFEYQLKIGEYLEFVDDLTEEDINNNENARKTTRKTRGALNNDCENYIGENIKNTDITKIDIINRILLKYKFKDGHYSNYQTMRNKSISNNLKHNEDIEVFSRFINKYFRKEINRKIGVCWNIECSSESESESRNSIKDSCIVKSNKNERKKSNNNACFNINNINSVSNISSNNTNDFKNINHPKASFNNVQKTINNYFSKIDDTDKSNINVNINTISNINSNSSLTNSHTNNININNINIPNINNINTNNTNYIPNIPNDRIHTNISINNTNISFNNSNININNIHHNNIPSIVREENIYKYSDYKQKQLNERQLLNETFSKKIKNLKFSLPSNISNLLLNTTNDLFKVFDDNTIKEDLKYIINQDNFGFNDLSDCVIDDLISDDIDDDINSKNNNSKTNIYSDINQNSIFPNTIDTNLCDCGKNIDPNLLKDLISNDLNINNIINNKKDININSNNICESNTINTNNPSHKEETNKDKLKNLKTKNSHQITEERERKTLKSPKTVTLTNHDKITLPLCDSCNNPHPNKYICPYFIFLVRIIYLLKQECTKNEKQSIILHDRREEIKKNIVPETNRRFINYKEKPDIVNSNHLSTKRKALKNKISDIFLNNENFVNENYEELKTIIINSNDNQAINYYEYTNTAEINFNLLSNKTLERIIGFFDKVNKNRLSFKNVNNNKTSSNNYNTTKNADYDDKAFVIRKKDNDCIFGKDFVEDSDLEDISNKENQN